MIVLTIVVDKLTIVTRSQYFRALARQGRAIHLQADGNKIGHVECRRKKTKFARERPFLLCGDHASSFGEKAIGMCIDVPLNLQA